LRGYRKQGVVDAIREAGGEIYAITSEPQSLASNAQQHWETGFEHIGDPHQEISGECTDRGWLSLFTHDWGDTFDLEASWVSHPKGYFQPGVLALNGDGRVLYRWRGVPTHKNMGGATERPTAQHVWARIARALESSANAADAPLDTDPALDSTGIPWPLFASLLIANGWFLNARGFKSTRHVMMAGVRLLAFASGWIAAFAWLPTLPVAAALAGWVAYITPKVRWVGREFQDVSASSP